MKRTLPFITTCSGLLLISGALLVTAEEPAPNCHPDMGAAAEATQTGSHVTTPMSDPSIVISETQLKSGDKLKTVLFKDFLVDKIYRSMDGPWKRSFFPLDSQSPSRQLWIRGYRAEVLDQKSGAASQEFMCHTNLYTVPKPDAPAHLRFNKPQLSISQGQKEIVFPRGTALRVENLPERQIDVTAMVLNNNDTDIHRHLDFKVSILYTDALKPNEKIIPLMQAAVATACLVDSTFSYVTDTRCESVRNDEVYRGFDGQQSTGHWWVPPGRQTIHSDVTRGLDLKYDTTLHYIWMHVHPYAESLELVDRTTGKSVWKGKVHNHRTRAAVLSTELYSSTQGIPVYKDHKYELITIYNNTTPRNIDAMAALWVYLHNKDAAL